MSYIAIGYYQLNFIKETKSSTPLKKEIPLFVRDALISQLHTMLAPEALFCKMAQSYSFAEGARSCPLRMDNRLTLVQIATN